MNYFIITAAGWTPTPNNKFVLGRTALQNSVEPQVSVSSEWQGKDAKYREYKIWQNEGWSRSFLQKLTVNGWKGVA